MDLKVKDRRTNQVVEFSVDDIGTFTNLGVGLGYKVVLHNGTTFETDTYIFDLIREGYTNEKGRICDITSI